MAFACTGFSAFAARVKILRPTKFFNASKPYFGLLCAAHMTHPRTKFSSVARCGFLELCRILPSMTENVCNMVALSFQFLGCHEDSSPLIVEDAMLLSVDFVDFVLDELDELSDLLSRLDFFVFLDFFFSFRSLVFLLRFFFSFFEDLLLEDLFVSSESAELSFCSRSARISARTSCFICGLSLSAVPFFFGDISSFVWRRTARLRKAIFFLLAGK